MIETATKPSDSAADLLADLVGCRREAAASARSAGAALVAVGTPVLPYDEGRVTPKPRYEHIVEEFGEVGRQAGVCGTHVHVAVADHAEGVAVIDGLRPWLPVLRAMSANSPYWRGRDTGYASWRSQVWTRFPSAGPAEPYGDPAGYRAATRALIDSGAAIDEGMLYLDARLSRNFPTVEVRVLDAMTEPGQTVLLAMLIRALVTTVAQQPAELSAAARTWRTDLLRAAHWRASRYGMTTELLDPHTGERREARAVVEMLLQYVDDALVETEDVDEVSQRAEDLLARGTGADRQRGVFDAGGGLQAVAADLRERFEATLA
jgi:glutamate---cysteine ligase / carboxylate-amine ligase